MVRDALLDRQDIAEGVEAEAQKLHLGRDAGGTGPARSSGQGASSIRASDAPQSCRAPQRDCLRTRRAGALGLYVGFLSGVPRLRQDMEGAHAKRRHFRALAEDQRRAFHVP